jgi:DNA repair exonuclease SbcCD ATPase subunit
MNTELLMGMCEDKIKTLESTLQQINKKIIDDGMSDELALELAKNRISLEYAKQEFDALKAQWDDERKYFESKAFKDALKELDALAKQADEYKAAALDSLDDVFENLQNWETTVRKHSRCAHKARADAKDLLMSEMGHVGNIMALKMKIQAWKRDVKFCESLNRR